MQSEAVQTVSEFSSLHLRWPPVHDWAFYHPRGHLSQESGQHEHPPRGEPEHRSGGASLYPRRGFDFEQRTAEAFLLSYSLIPHLKIVIYYS